MSSKRLQLLESQICGTNSALQSHLASQQNKATFVSTESITDSGKKYPEIIDYHPEKKVRRVKRERVSSHQFPGKRRKSSLQKILNISITNIEPLV